MSTLHILWDESHHWGLLAVRAAEAMGLTFNIVTAEQIRNEILKKEKPSLLLIPGGSARYKAQALQKKGLDAIRTYVHEGGHYLGFCGGAGLALTWEGSLALCPWARAGFTERMQHFMSGHLYMNLPETANNSQLYPEELPQSPLLPVWWPGRFKPEDDPSIKVLAAYMRPGPDFWLTDLHIAALPPHIFTTWKNLYGFTLTPSFLEGQPCVIQGNFGKGAYILSYSHLETPASPHANSWLAHIFRTFGEQTPSASLVPAWNMEKETPQWEDNDLYEVEKNIEHVVHTGLEQNLLFARNDWLLGWRAGIPGSNLNSILALIQTIRRRPPTEKALDFWYYNRKDILESSLLFKNAGEEYLLTERLAMTLSKSMPEMLPANMLKQQRASLFGPPMQAGGLFGQLVSSLDFLAYLQLQGNID